MAHGHNHAHRINPGMHYTVVLALIISLITTFFLGMILADTLWGSGLGYFNQISRTGLRQKLYEQQINRWLYINRAQAQTVQSTQFQFQMNGMTYNCTL